MLLQDKLISSTVCETVTESTAASDPSRVVPFITAAPKRRKRSPNHTQSSSRPGRKFPPRQDKPLAFFEDAPEVLKFNKYIRSGYRAGFTNWDCFRSTLRIHNETCNIWSHLIPLLVWVGLVKSGMYQPWEEAPWVFYLSTISTCMCLAGSVLYHTLIACHCDYHKWLKLDVCGIYAVTLATQWLIFPAGFMCSPVTTVTSVVVYYTWGLLGMWYSLRAASALHRGLPMLGLSVMRLAGLVARPLMGGSSLGAFWVYLLAEVFAIVGGMLNVVRFPEKWFQPSKPRTPGTFDLIANSHQLMHVLVVGTMVCGQIALGMDVKYFYSGEATCPA